MILLHGTTRARAERILRDGPDPRFQEPGGLPCDHGFSMSIEGGPYYFGHPEQFDFGYGLEELLETWQTLAKSIRSLP